MIYNKLSTTLTYSTIFSEIQIIKCHNKHDFFNLASSESYCFVI